jgi:hypothetical protein
LNEELYLAFQFREQKLTFAIVEGDKVEFFQGKTTTQGNCSLQGPIAFWAGNPHTGPSLMGVSQWPVAHGPLVLVFDVSWRRYRAAHWAFAHSLAVERFAIKALFGTLGVLKFYAPVNAIPL